jgi:Xaa-Pro aminopeptidase
MEPPVAGASADPDDVALEPGMALSLASCLERPDAGVCLLREIVIVRGDGAERVTRMADAPAW